MSAQTLSPTSQPCFVRDNNIGVHLVNDESASARSTLLAIALVNVVVKIQRVNYTPCVQ